MARGIEVFGRNATVVEHRSAARGARTPALGAAALLVAVAAIAVFAAAVIERSRDSDLVELLTWVALGASSLAVLGGLVALVSGRGRLPGVAAVVLGALANPWILTQLLEWAAGFVE